MNVNNKELFKNIAELLVSSRFKSFYWRFSMMFVSALCTLLANNLAQLELQGEFVIVFGLILGEISKHLNTKYGNIKK